MPYYTTSIIIVYLNMGFIYPNSQGQWAWKNDLKGRCACEYGYNFEDGECQKTFHFGNWFASAWEEYLGMVFTVIVLVCVAGCWICKWKKDSLFAPGSKMYSVFK